MRIYQSKREREIGSEKIRPKISELMSRVFPGKGRPLALFAGGFTIVAPEAQRECKP
jgi:hypothetical protein